MEKQGMGSNAPSPKYSPRSRNASHERHERGRIEPRMDTNEHQWAGGTTKNTKTTKGGGKKHEWARRGIISCNNFMVFQMIWNQTC